MHEPFDSARLPGFSGAIRGLRDSTRLHVATLGWLDCDAGNGTHNADLPSDLFVVTLRCGDTPARRAAIGAELEVVLTPVREHARDYRVQGRSQIVVASLTPMGMLSIFRTSLLGLPDQRLPLAHLCGRARERELWAALQPCHGLDECAEVFGRWLETRALEGPALSSTDQRIARTASQVSHMDLAHYDVHTLAAQEGITRRQLERDFRRRLGVSPGAYARLVRFQRAASAVSAGRPMVDAALDSGYADQAHMSRAIKHYTGLTPRMLAAQGARPGRDLLRSGLAGRVFMLDLPPTWAVATAQEPPSPQGLVIGHGSLSMSELKRLGPQPLPHHPHFAGGAAPACSHEERHRCALQLDVGMSAEAKAPNAHEPCDGRDALKSWQTRPRGPSCSTRPAQPCARWRAPRCAGGSADRCWRSIGATA